MVKLKIENGIGLLTYDTLEGIFPFPDHGTDGSGVSVLNEGEELLLGEMYVVSFNLGF